MRQGSANLEVRRQEWVSNDRRRFYRVSLVVTRPGLIPLFDFGFFCGDWQECLVDLKKIEVVFLTLSRWLPLIVSVRLYEKALESYRMCLKHESDSSAPQLFVGGHCLVSFQRGSAEKANWIVIEIGQIFMSEVVDHRVSLG